MALSAPASHFKRLKTWVWLCLNEVRLRRAMRSVDAVQANGIPAFDAYAKRKPSHHLYFDTRLSVDAVVSPQALAVKLAALEAKTRPLRLAFSGRLIAGKGADLLVPLAARLRRAGLDFRLDLYGSGELEAEIHRDIASQSLGDVVRLHAAVDFATVLVPIFQHEIDLFICCHRQGDPSCTYAETLGCGIPFVGFANESLKSMVDHHDIGWLAPMNDVDALADIVVRLDRDRPEITRKSHLARHFGLAYSMEAMFKGRVSHCSSQLRASTALV
jgi:glycosyltransferase involved in cell wall biosynthesis